MELRFLNGKLARKLCAATAWHTVQEPKQSGANFDVNVQLIQLHECPHPIRN